MKKSEVFRLRLTPVERLKLEELAQASGLSKSNVIRLLIAESFTRKITQKKEAASESTS